jgi:hypothetical protein
MRVWRKTGRGIAPLILNLSLGGNKWSTLRPGYLHPGKEPQRPLKRRLVGPRRRYGRFGELKKLFSLPEFESRTVQPVAQSEY